MCTVVLLIRPGHAWPVALAANRDERIDRAWDPPGAWWPDQPGVVAGRDRSAGGTWMGINRHGVAACVLNRPGTLGPAAGKHSRGELPLLALAHDSAASAAAALCRLDAGLWRGFNLVLADRRGGVFVRGAGHGHPQAVPLLTGVSMITAHDPNDADSPRVARHLARFRAAAPPAPGDPAPGDPAPGDPAPGDWAAWQAIVADRAGEAGEQINVEPRAGFGTVCSSLLALPAEGRPVWLFAAGAPDVVPFRGVDLG